MTTTGEVIALTERHQMGNYARFPVAFVRGSGSLLFDAEGGEYLDFLGGIAVALLGHAHPAVTEAISRQAAELVHVSNLFHVPVQSEAAALLAGAAGGGKVFFCNSGTEANEAAIKLARKFSADRGRKDAYEIVAVEGSFHGRTYGSLSATGQPKFHSGFEPMVPGFRSVPFGDLAALDAALTDRTCAFIVEPIQGEIGVRTHPEGYLAGAARLCRERGILLVADEIQTGMGRTGSFLASTRMGVVPDVVSLAKGIANGLPLGAVVARDEVAAAFTPGTHGSTFGGNPVACAAAAVVIRTVSDPAFLAEVDRKGKLLADGLARIAEGRTDVTAVRGMGLMVAMETTGETKDAARKALLEERFVVSSTGSSFRFLPPLTVSDAEIAEALSRFARILPPEGRK
jgi:predicted acetylornithine/succinylornithine family transaminase